MADYGPGDHLRQRAHLPDLLPALPLPTDRMTALRKLLVYVLCALLALGTAPRSAERCSAAAAANPAASDAAPLPPRSCCAAGACCCGSGADCGAKTCKGGERRAPAPRLPAGRSAQLALPAPPLQRPWPARDGDSGGGGIAAATVDRALRGFRALPARLRQ